MTELAEAMERRRRFDEYVLPEIQVLFRVALSVTGQPSDAEDLVQDTLLRAWRSIETFDGRHNRAWLLTILRNANVNGHRRRRPYLLDDPDLGLERRAANQPVGPSAEDLLCDRTFDDTVEAALNELPAGFREVITLVDVDGLTYAEAAQVLNLPVGTVMSRLHRARKRIRSQLAAAGLTPRRKP